MSTPVELRRNKFDKARVAGTVSMTRKTAKQLAEARARKAARKSSATKLLKEEGGRGVDLRGQAADYQKGVEIIPLQDSVAVQATMNYASLRSLALGYVLEALRRGWRGSSGAPFYAARYLYDSFKSCCLGSFPSIQSAAYAFWVVCDALYPKDAKFKTGSIQYAWRLFGLDEFEPVTIMDRIIVVLGNPSEFEINGLPILSLPAPYTEELGAVAIASLFQFFPDDLWGGKVSLAKGATAMGKDCSSFACVYPEIGSAFGSPGGVASTVQTEVFIRAPIFCQFALYQPEASWRGFQEYRKNAGTPMSVFPRIMSLRKFSDLNDKVSPIYKFIDFDEIVETLALTIGSAMEIASVENIGTYPVICPLTSQQLQIVLRQTCLQQFCNGYAQDLRYNSIAALDFTPLSVGSNGVDYTIRAITGMLLPQLLAENLRAFGKTMKKDSMGQLHELIPVLGRYVVPQLGNYNYSSNGSALPVFSVDPAEVPIDIINMTAIDPSNSQLVYLDANGEQIEIWVEKWNTYVQALGSHLSVLTTPGSEKKINALEVLCFTQHSSLVEIPVNLNDTPVPVTGTAASSSASTPSKRKSSVRPKQQGTPRTRSVFAQVTPAVESTFYTAVCCASTSSTYPLYATSWNILKCMIKPSYIGDDGLGFEGTVAAQQVFQVEPKLLIHVPDGDGAQLVGTGSGRTFLFDQHLQMAKLDVRSALNANGTEIARSLNALTAMGRGGWFTSLAGNFLEAVGVKGARGVATAIGDATGL